MGYFYLVSIALIALLVGFVLGSKLITKITQSEIKEILKTHAIDRASYLFTLRREIANILIWQDPKRFVKIYQELFSEINSYKSWRLEEINKRLLELNKKYPEYNDFDCIGTKEYVLYVGSDKNYEELELCYQDIAKFIALSLISNPSWKDARHQIVFDLANEFISDKVKFLQEYATGIENTKFVFRIDKAMEYYYAYRDNDSGFLDNILLSVRPKRSLVPDDKYTVHIKSTNQFAIYSVFFDGEAECIEYYLSDPTFEKETYFSYDRSLLEKLKKPV